MTHFSASWFFRQRGGRAIALAAALCLGAAGAQAQTNPPTPQTTPPTTLFNNPLRAATNWLGMTTDAPDAPEFVRQTRPELEKLDYSHLTGVDKKRAPVRTPAEVEADKAELVAEREKSAARLKQLGTEKMDPVEPVKAPPVTDEHF